MAKKTYARIDSATTISLGTNDPVTGVEAFRAGVAEQPEVAVADAGYWHHVQMDAIVSRGMQVLNVALGGGKAEHPAKPGR